MNRPTAYGLKLLTAMAVLFISFAPRAGRIPAVLAAATAPGYADAQREAKVIDGAKKEAKLVFWNQGQAKEMQPVLDKFRKAYPFLQVEYWRADESTLREKLLSEARAQVYNVDVSGAEIDFILELRKAGLMKSMIGRMRGTGRRSTKIGTAIGSRAIFCRLSPPTIPISFLPLKRRKAGTIFCTQNGKVRSRWIETAGSGC